MCVCVCLSVCPSIYIVYIVFVSTYARYILPALNFSRILCAFSFLSTLCRFFAPSLGGAGNARRGVGCRLASSSQWSRNWSKSLVDKACHRIVWHHVILYTLVQNGTLHGFLSLASSTCVAFIAIISGFVSILKKESDWFIQNKKSCCFFLTGKSKLVVTTINHSTSENQLAFRPQRFPICEPGLILDFSSSLLTFPSHFQARILNPCRAWRRFFFPIDIGTTIEPGYWLLLAPLWMHEKLQGEPLWNLGQGSRETPKNTKSVVHGCGDFVLGPEPVILVKRA